MTDQSITERVKEKLDEYKDKFSTPYGIRELRQDLDTRCPPMDFHALEYFLEREDELLIEAYTQVVGDEDFTYNHLIFIDDHLERDYRLMQHSR